MSITRNLSILCEVNTEILRLGITVARLKLKGIGGGLVFSGGACGLICITAAAGTKFAGPFI